MLSHYNIKLLHIVFTFFVGGSAVWLLFRCVLFDGFAQAAVVPRLKMCLTVQRDNIPFLTIQLTKACYRIGRGPECDITLKGAGIPLNIGELISRGAGWIYRRAKTATVTINGAIPTSQETELHPGDVLEICGYHMNLKNSD